MYYDRQIKYFDYKKGGVRLKSAGYLKIEIRDENCNLLLQIAGLPSAENGTGQVIGLWEDREEMLGNISLQDGRGNKELGFMCRRRPLDNDENRRGISDSFTYEGLQGIRIPLGADRELYCKIGNWKDSEKLTDPYAKSRVTDEERKTYAEPLVSEEVSKVSNGAVSGAEELRVAGEISKGLDEIVSATVEMFPEESEVIVTNVSEKKNLSEAVTEATGQEGIMSEVLLPEGGIPAALMSDTAVPEGNPAEIMSGTAKSEKNPPDREPEPNQTPAPGPRRMLEEKWEQLWTVYPHRRPFRDEREYLQIGPEDFVIFRDRFYKLVHNSFLLHGFYNYQHLILTRLERRGENFFYIGVPGNFYEREKQVAVMYGFESFECAEEPAGQGDFGYYMIRVEI